MLRPIRRAKIAAYAKVKNWTSELGVDEFGHQDHYIMSTSWAPEEDHRKVADTQKPWCKPRAKKNFIDGRIAAATTDSETKEGLTWLRGLSLIELRRVATASLGNVALPNAPIPKSWKQEVKKRVQERKAYKVAHSAMRGLCTQSLKTAKYRSALVKRYDEVKINVRDVQKDLSSWLKDVHHCNNDWKQLLAQRNIPDLAINIASRNRFIYGKGRRPPRHGEATNVKQVACRHCGVY